MLELDFFFHLTKIGSKDIFFFPEVVGKFTKIIDSGGGDVDWKC